MALRSEQRSETARTFLLPGCIGWCNSEKERMNLKQLVRKTAKRFPTRSGSAIKPKSGASQQSWCWKTLVYRKWDTVFGSSLEHDCSIRMAFFVLMRAT